ncbi:MAG: LysM peptidoglycan-binding domain-containing protein [Myxococcales bacterium]|nr:LysM peptidoglycan-binding domain-containing protein [Myxococcales bacterium]
MKVTVRPGDSLWVIAQRNDVTLKALISANPQIKNPNLIYAGQQVTIPGTKDTFEPGPSSNSGGEKYRVRAGDTMSGIAQRSGVSLRALIDANPQVKNPNLIYPGQMLNIPSGGKAPEQPAPVTPGPSPVSGIENRPGVKGNAEQTIKFFMSKGLTRAQAAGIAGNLLYESGFNPSAVGDGGTSFGVAQWHLGRGEAMKRWTKEHGYSSTSFKGQLEYLWYELNHGESYALGKLRASGNAYDAGMAFCRYFERPAYINPARGQAAQKFYNESLS